MTIINKIFGARNPKGFQLKFSNVHGQWQVYCENRLLYLGEKSDCQKFLDNAANAQKAQ